MRRNRSNNCILFTLACPELSAPASGDIVVTGNLEGDTITVTCDLAFELSTTGSDFLTCQSNGTWDGTMATCVPVGKCW